LVLKLIKICGFKKLSKFVNIRTVNIHLLTTQKPQWNGNSELCVADSDDNEDTAQHREQWSNYEGAWMGPAPPKELAAPLKELP